MEDKIQNKINDLNKQKETQESMYHQLTASLKQTEINIISLNGAITALTDLLKETSTNEN